MLLQTECVCTSEARMLLHSYRSTKGLSGSPGTIQDMGHLSAAQNALAAAVEVLTSRQPNNFKSQAQSCPQLRKTLEHGPAEPYAPSTCYRIFSAEVCTVASSPRFDTACSVAGGFDLH